MRVGLAAGLLLAFSATDALAQSGCLDRDALVRLDAEWENALLERDVSWLEAHLADEFVWVHNHAGQVDTKASLLASVRGASAGVAPTRSRVQSGVKARIVGSTGLTTGFTVVDRGTGPTRYSFMRTYVAVAGRCLLLGNHTMVVPETESFIRAGAS